MWCPFCSHTDTKVVDSRLTGDGMQIRRRRQCAACSARFNTYESPELKAPRIIKSNGAREIFSENKLRNGMLRALEKRPVETREVERSIRKLLREIRT
ncbi:MAG TPA: transcriptional regulator NrdR, partial [Xanthomonadales bacterium]|nr:transcriptional regulator NrdR [Xanthomonadales bacterium]